MSTGGEPLDGARLVAFLASADLDRSRRFFVDIVGLRLVEESPFACVFHSGSTELRVTKVDQPVPAWYTVLGWTVPDIEATVGGLWARGARFEQFEGMDQDGFDAWTAPGGTRVAWFKDPDGNLLSLSQPPQGPLA